MENKKPKTYSYRPRKNENPYVIDWLEKQSNLNDAIRFLIEEDIKKNGIRDLSQFIPAVRSLSNIPSSNIINNKLDDENINNIIKKMDNVKETKQIQQEKKEIEVQKVKEIEKEVNDNFDDIPSCYQ